MSAKSYSALGERINGRPGRTSGLPISRLTSRDPLSAVVRISPGEVGQPASRLANFTCLAQIFAVIFGEHPLSELPTAIFDDQSQLLVDFKADHGKSRCWKA